MSFTTPPLSLVTSIPDIRMNPLKFVFETLALRQTPGTLWLEFGVWSGRTINYIADHASGQQVHGFDSFEGLPETWRTGYEKGEFNRGGALPAVRANVHLVKGLFSDTLPGFLQERPGQQVAFLHLDADLYGSTTFVLEALKDRLDGCVVVFDELLNYDGFDGAAGELRAWHEFVSKYDVDYQWIGMDGRVGAGGEQAALRILSVRGDDVDAAAVTTTQSTPLIPSAKPNVYFAVFAGRKRYLSILVRYLDPLIAAGSITQVHLWDFTRTESDAAYLRELCGSGSRGYRLMQPDGRHSGATPDSIWADAYQYYIDNTFPPDSVLVKCDDDVVYLSGGVAGFDAFIATVASEGGAASDHALFFPNIVNNDACARNQTILRGRGGGSSIEHDDLLAPFAEVDFDARTEQGFGEPLTDWYKRTDCAAAAHRHFLANRATYNGGGAVAPWDSRFSINMFAAKMSTARLAFVLMKTVGKFSSDERFLSADLCRLLDRPNLIVSSLTAVHFVYMYQDDAKLDAAFLHRYDALSRGNVDDTVDSPLPYVDPMLRAHLERMAADPNGMPRAHRDYLAVMRDQYGFVPKVAYDIGSCVGQWTKAARQLWPDAKYVLFDGYAPYEFLYKNAKEAYQIGVLSDTDGRVVRFYQNDGAPNANSYYREVGCPYGDFFPIDRYIERICRTLDSVVAERGFPLPDLIKIDVQGCEMDIIKGALETLRSAQYLIVELQDTNYNDGAPKADVTLPFIESLGWTCIARKFSDNGPDADYCFRRNDVAVPPSMPRPQLAVFQPLYGALGTLHPQVTGYLDRAAVARFDGAGDTCWTVDLVGWAFQLGAPAAARPVRFRSGAAALLPIPLEAVRRDDVVAAHYRTTAPPLMPAIAWCGWNQKVFLPPAAQRPTGKLGTLEMQIGDGEWTAFMDVVVV